MHNPFRSRLVRALSALMIAVVAVVAGAGAAEAGVPDQHNPADPNCGYAIWGPDVFFVPGIEGPRSGAQTFTAGVTGLLDQIDIAVERREATEDPLVIEIREVVDGQPGTTVLASTTVPATAIPTTTVPPVARLVPVVFSTPASVVAGTQYAIFVFTTGDSTYGVHCSTNDRYARGALFGRNYLPPGGWIRTDFDMLFRTYVAEQVTPADRISALTLTVEKLPLHHGIRKSLLSKLEAVADAYDAGEVDRACSTLRAFSNALRAQSGKHIPSSTAAALAEAAEEVRQSIGC